MNVLIVMGSHRLEGNTATLCPAGRYVGMYSVRDTDNLASFQTAQAVAGAKAFARSLQSV